MAILTWLLHNRVPCVGLGGYVILMENLKRAGSVQAAQYSHGTGFPFAFGVFENYYAINALFPESTSGIVVIGTTSTVAKPNRLWNSS